MFRLATGVALLVFLASLVGAAPSGGTLPNAVVMPLSTTDLPAGSTSSKPPQLQDGLCAGLNLPPSGPVTTAGFQTGQFVLEEALTLSDAVGSTFNDLVNQYAACRVVRPVHGLNVRGTGRRLSLPQVGDESQSFSFSLTVNGSPVNEDLVVFRTDLSCGVLEFVSSSGPVSPQQVASIASIAASKTGSPTFLPAGSKHVSATVLLSDACNATFFATAFRSQGHLTYGNDAMRIDAYFGSAGGLLTLTEHGDQTFSLIMNGPSIYLKGNRAFWQMWTSNSRTVSPHPGRWLDMTSDKKDVTDLSVNKGTVLSGCGAGESATYTGNAAVNGVKVYKVLQNWSGESDTYYIEKGSTPYILRITGRQSRKNIGDLVLSDYGVQPDTSAPPGAIPFPDVGSTGSTGSSGNTGSSS